MLVKDLKTKFDAIAARDATFLDASAAVNAVVGSVKARAFAEAKSTLAASEARAWLVPDSPINPRLCAGGGAVGRTCGCTRTSRTRTWSRTRR